MKRLLFVGSCLAIVTAPVLYPNEPVPVRENLLRGVEIYPDSARLTRELKIALDGEGTVQFLVDGLPSNLDAGTITMEPGQAPADLRIGGVRFEVDRERTDRDPEVIELRENIRALERDIRRHRQSQEGLEQRLAHYRALAKAVIEALGKEADTATLELGTTSWQQLETVRSEVLAERETLEDAIRELEKQLEESKKSLREMEQQVNRLSGIIHFEVRAPAAAEATLNLHYVVREARWAPVYEVRPEPAEGVLSWTYGASLWQNTGEDWEGIPVVLNASRPIRGTRPPPPPVTQLRQITAPQKVSTLSRVRMETAVVADAMEPEASFQATTTGFIIEVPESVSLASGSGSQRHTLFEKPLQTRFWSEATPALSEEAFLIAEAVNTIDWPILAGSASFYVDGRLTGRDRLELLLPGDEITLGLGRNPMIQVERREIVRRESEGGLIDRVKRHQRKFETTVTNRMPVAHEVVLRDSVPVSQNNRIQIRIQSPRNLETEEDTGHFEWRREVDSQKSATLTLEYEVTHPADWTVPPF